VESAECGLSSVDSWFSCFVEFEVLLTFVCRFCSSLLVRMYVDAADYLLHLVLVVSAFE